MLAAGDHRKDYCKEVSKIGNKFCARSRVSAPQYDWRMEGQNIGTQNYG
jgi:hypothetical protein